MCLMLRQKSGQQKDNPRPSSCSSRTLRLGQGRTSGAYRAHHLPHHVPHGGLDEAADRWTAQRGASHARPLIHVAPNQATPTTAAPRTRGIQVAAILLSAAGLQTPTPTDAHPCIFACVCRPQIIEKEERQLREPKPRLEVSHVWDAETLKGRATLWKEVQPKPLPPNAIEMARSKLGMSVPQFNDAEEASRMSRAKLFAARRTRDALDAMERERSNDAKSGEAGFKSAASLFSPADLSALRPTYAPNEKMATNTTNELVGLGAKRVPLVKSRFNRQRAFPPDFTSCRNNPDRSLVERAVEESRMRQKPWLTPSKPPVPEMPASHVFPRSTSSSFCTRPGEFPISKW